MPIPRELGDQPWEDLDFFGWTDPSYPGRGYLALPQEDELIGVALRFELGGTGKTQMCSICLTPHSGGGVTLMTARKAGDSGRRGNSIGTYMCADLACSLYARNKRRPTMGTQYREDLSPEEKVERLRSNIAGFVGKLY